MFDTGVEFYDILIEFHTTTNCVFLPIISIMGMIGNLISVLILQRKPFKTNILFAYLQCLSTVDFIYLFFVFVWAVFGHSIRYQILYDVNINLLK